VHHDKIHDLHDSSNIIRVMKSRMVTWAGHGGGKWPGEEKYLQSFWWGNLKERGHFEV
jgi:hypothetical protein